MNGSKVILYEWIEFVGGTRISPVQLGGPSLPQVDPNTDHPLIMCKAEFTDERPSTKGLAFCGVEKANEEVFRCRADRSVDVWLVSMCRKAHFTSIASHSLSDWYMHVS